MQDEATAAAQVTADRIVEGLARIRPARSGARSAAGSPPSSSSFGMYSNVRDVSSRHSSGIARFSSGVRRLVAGRGWFRPGASPLTTPLRQDVSATGGKGSATVTEIVTIARRASRELPAHDSSVVAF
jgi:hypothetical protein